MKPKTYLIFFLFMFFMNLMIHLIIYKREMSLIVVGATLIGSLTGVGVLFLIDKLRTKK